MDTHKIGYTEQLNWVVSQYPEYKDVITYFITGNHDATHFRNGFADIGVGIAQLRDDMVYLGHNFARVNITPNLTMSLVHPTDGISQSLSLKLQHLIERNANRRSDIMLVGHYHKSVNIKYNGVYGYIMPSFEYKTPFMDDNNIVSDVAGTIFTIRVDKEGNLLSIGTEYVSYDE